MNREVSQPGRSRGASGSYRRGMVLFVVLVVIVLLTLAAYAFTEIMVVEHAAADAAGSAYQARALSDSGIAFAQATLAQDDATLDQAGGIYDDESRFAGVEVCDDGRDGFGRFSLLVPNLDGSGKHSGLRYGLEDESTKLNLLSLLEEDRAQSGSGRTRLMTLPGMTEETADAILDWIDDDDTIREFGCELEYYSSLDPPYLPSNGPPESLDELMLVRGITPGIWFGRDANGDGLVDDRERTQDDSGDADHSRGEMELGWRALLTIHSQAREPKPASGEPIDLNDGDLVKLHDDLSAAFSREWADFIVAYRQNGAAAAVGNPAGGPASGQLNLQQPARVRLISVLDLVGVQVQVRFQGADQDSRLVSPFPASGSTLREPLNTLLDGTTIGGAAASSGRININQAPAAVLRSLPGIPDDKVTAIVSQREVELIGEESLFRHPTWLLTEGIVELAEMRRWLPLVCTEGAVYRATAVGFFDWGGPVSRVEAVFDASSGQPRLLFWRDVSHTGKLSPLR